MRDRQAERVTEQGGDGEPVGQPADQRRLGARSQQIDPEAGLAQPGGADVDEAHGDQQRRGEAAMTAQGPALRERRVLNGNFGHDRSPVADGAGIMAAARLIPRAPRSEEHTSELQSLMRLTYAVFCLTKKIKT